jgi:N-acetylmuramoyl-L-alanine amidase
MGRSLKGNSPLNVSLGGKSLNVKGENRNGDAVITVTLPTGLEYRTERSDDGKRESVVIENRIVEISRKVFGNIGDNIIVYTLTPCEYSYSLKNDILEIKLESTYQGVERSAYDYQISPLLEKMTIKESSGSPPDTTLRIETKNLGDYRIFQTSDDNALNIVLTSTKRSDNKNNKLVVLDPGHGGRDTGANGSVLHEKDVNLDIALKAGQILAARKFDVAYTRDSDIYLTLSERANIANELNAAVFVSVHCNSADNPSASGTETYYYASLEDPELFMQKDQRAKLASLLQKNLIAQLRLADRGVKQDRFTVIMNTNMPSALVETAFINNPSEEACLMDSSFRNKAATAIADAITEYMNDR